MHSSIFQLSKYSFFSEDGEFFADELMTQDNFEFSGEYVSNIFQVADYVMDSEDPNGDIQSLLNNLNAAYYEFDANEKSIVFKEGFHESYFSSKLQLFLKNAKEIEKNNELFFKGDDVYALIKWIRDRFDFYVYNEEGREKPFDDFVREDLIVGEVYYFGSVVKYHC